MRTEHKPVDWRSHQVALFARASHPRQAQSRADYWAASPHKSLHSSTKASLRDQNELIFPCARERARERIYAYASPSRRTAQPSHENKTTTQRVNGGRRQRIPPADTKIRTSRGDADRITRMRAGGGGSEPHTDARRER